MVGSHPRQRRGVHAHAQHSLPGPDPDAVAGKRRSARRMGRWVVHRMIDVVPPRVRRDEKRSIQKCLRANGYFFTPAVVTNTILTFAAVIRDSAICEWTRHGTTEIFFFVARSITPFGAASTHAVPPRIIRSARMNSGQVSYAKSHCPQKPRGVRAGRSQLSPLAKDTKTCFLFNAVY